MLKGQLPGLVLGESKSVAEIGSSAQRVDRLGAALFCLRDRRKGGSRALMLVALLAFGASLSSVGAATTYYAAVNGSSGNTGLSSSSPWPLDYACGRVGAGNSIIVLPGTYTGGAYAPAFPNVTLRSQVKWGARISGSSIGIAAYPAGAASGLVIDGFEITGQSQDAIYFAAGNSNCVVRNCWIHHIGTQGIEAHYLGNDNTTVENCLIEHCGSDTTFHQALYLGGHNMLVRNNVIRYNAASAIAVSTDAAPNDVQNARIYNNLCYGNHWGINFCDHYPATAFFYGNTCIGNGSTQFAIGGANEKAYAYATNNIFIGGADYRGGIAPDIIGDYNAYDINPRCGGTHNVSVSLSSFVNPSQGLYWLASGSAARNAALATVHGPVDFFGNPLSSAPDIGAYQYNSAYVADTRTLDPSSTGGANYWQILGSTDGSSGSGSTGSGSSGSGSPTNGFTFQASAGILTAPFIVTNGYVCQMVDTLAPDGGRAVYNFTTTTAGVYVVTAVVNAPDGSHNSFYVTMDGAAPDEPYNVWDIPYTSGFENETVAWRANGTWDANAFAPKAFALAAGAHSLVIVGRESNTQLQSIQIQPSSFTAPVAAPVLRQQ